MAIMKKEITKKTKAIFTNDSVLSKPTAQEQKQFRTKLRKNLGKEWAFVADF